MQFKFIKDEKLKSEKEIKFLFNEGKSIFLHPLRLIYLFTPSNTHECKVLISASKRNFKRAIDRNLLKRRIREAYRKNSLKLKQELKEKDYSARIAFIYSSPKIVEYKDIEQVVIRHLENIINKIPKSEENI